MINSTILTDKDTSISTMYYTANAQFSTFNTPNLWKTIINDVLIARINIRLLCIRVLNVFTNGRVIRCGNVLFCSDLGEQFITLSPRSQPPRNIT